MIKGSALFVTAALMSACCATAALAHGTTGTTGRAAAAGAFPNKLMRIVTSGTGTNGDFIARLLAPGLAQSLGQQLIVENRTAGLIIGEAVTTAQPSALFPGLPTVASAGLKSYAVATANGFFVPARRPVAVIERLEQELSRQFSLPEIRERLLTATIEAIGGKPDVLAAAVKDENTVFGKLIRDTGARAN